jgi:phage gpG-like protein
MIEALLKTFEDRTAAVAKAAHDGAVRMLQKAAFAIFKTAQAEIQEDPKPSPAGQPPHTRRGQIKRAMRYSVERAEEYAVIGPRESLVGTSAAAQEFGGQYKRQEYPKRPFMGPALKQSLHLVPPFFTAEVHP